MPASAVVDTAGIVLPRRRELVAYASIGGTKRSIRTLEYNSTCRRRLLVCFRRMQWFVIDRATAVTVTVADPLIRGDESRGARTDDGGVDLHTRCCEEQGGVCFISRLAVRSGLVSFNRERWIQSG